MIRYNNWHIINKKAYRLLHAYEITPSLQYKDLNKLFSITQAQQFASI